MFHHSFLQPSIANLSIPEAKSFVPLFSNLTRGILRLNQSHLKKWLVFSAAAETYNLTEEESKSWESCRVALKPFSFSTEEEDKMLAKAFGQLQSPYWSEDRTREVPRASSVSKTLDYLRSLDLSDDDLSKLLKKFPEVLGCSLEDEVKNNVQVLERVWGIEGKSLKNLLKRNPKVLGYSVDCKGDCVAKCTRCWVRF